MNRQELAEQLRENMHEYIAEATSWISVEDQSPSELKLIRLEECIFDLIEKVEEQ